MVLVQVYFPFICGLEDQESPRRFLDKLSPVNTEDYSIGESKTKFLAQSSTINDCLDLEFAFDERTKDFGEDSTA